MSASDEEEYVDALGVITALEKTCELEAKLRQAIQDTHPLTTTLDWDFHAADREREALLAISEQLEYLEDKLREYRFLEPADLENKAVLLGQLDAVRRELVEVVDRFAPHVLFGKEAVREVLAFAQVADGAEEGGEELGEEGDGPEQVEGEKALEPNSRSASGSQGGFASEIEALLEEEESAAAAARLWTQHAQRERARRAQRESYDAEQEPALIPAVRRSTGALQRPPRYPAPAVGGAKEAAAYGRHGGAPHASPKRPGVAQAGAAASPTSLHQQHQQQLAAMHGASPGRSAFLQAQQGQHAQRGGGGSGTHPLAANAVPGTAAANGGSPGAAATAASRSATGGRQGRRQLDVDSADRAPSGGGRLGADTYSFSQAPPAAAPAAVASYPPSSYAPSSYAPSDGAPSSRPSPQPPAPAAAAPSAATAAAPGGRAAASRTFLLTKLNRAQEGGRRRSSDSAAGSRYGLYSRVSDEDIYGALDDRGGGRPASITNPSPRQYGGFVKIRDRLSAAEEGAERVPGPRSPVPPRIYGEGVREGDSWEGDCEVQAAAHAASVSLDAPALPRPGRYSEARPARTAPVRASSPAGDRLQLAYSSGGAGAAGRAQHSTARGGEAERPPRSDGGGPGLVGRLTNLLLTGAAATALVVVAQHAGPAVVQKSQLVGREVARKVQEGQQQLAARRAAAKQRRQEEEAAARRKAAHGAAGPALPWQQGGRGDQAPPRAGGARMADLPPRPAAGHAGAEPAHKQRGAGAGRMADLPPHRQPSRGADVRPQPAPAKRQPGAAADPLPPFLAAAAAARVAGGTAGGTGPRVYAPQPGQLFPAMPPPDVSASMG